MLKTCFLRVSVNLSSFEVKNNLTAESFSSPKILENSRMCKKIVKKCSKHVFYAFPSISHRFEQKKIKSKNFQQVKNNCFMLKNNVGNFSTIAGLQFQLSEQCRHLLPIARFAILAQRRMLTSNRQNILSRTKMKKVENIILFTGVT